MDIAAIPTTINGHAYRSRLEAFWALVLETLGVTAIYEPFTFNLPDCEYAPDFWLPECQRFLEVKPDVPTAAERHKAEQLFLAMRLHVFFLSGQPYLTGRDLFNMGVYWEDGRPLGATVTIGLLYVFGLQESQEDYDRVVYAAHHARALVDRARRVMPSIRDILAPPPPPPFPPFYDTTREDPDHDQD